MTDSLLTKSWLSELRNYEHIYVGFSGGLDSTVLLHSLTKQVGLFSKLIAVHVNHGLSPNAMIWQNHCEKFCQHLKIPLLIEKVVIDRLLSVEQAARIARYKAFASFLKRGDCLILGHHLDDQAETVFLQLFRGTGIDGLAAMKPQLSFAQGQLLRPFLACTRQLLHDYAELHQLKWVEDESNEDIAFSRNYLRHEIIPRLRKQWPKVSHSMARAASHCQQAQANLEDLAKIDCPELNHNPASLDLVNLKELSIARLSNCLRVWLRLNGARLPSAKTFGRIINEVIYARRDAEAKIEWDKVSIRCYQDRLYLVQDLVRTHPLILHWDNFPEPVFLGEGRGYLSASVGNKGLMIPSKRKIAIKYRQGGEEFYWHGQTKKLKKLLQEWRIPPWLRDTIPLVYVNNQLVAIPGYATSDRFYQYDVKNIYVIQWK